MLDHRVKRAAAIASAACFAMLAAGCVTVATTPAAPRLAVADAAIADAISADASQYDAADLATARRKLTRAHDEAAQGNDDIARALADEAAVDARLAATTARAAKAADANAAVQSSIRALHDEIARTPQ
ncbi:MAG TPA: DUF4398 domain-containing protein [Casimicrobiaceae bacterium]|jgi:septal ring factor EnvC (AmiA/AmiB activator)|nr:DUF4398 domain-containing protein [Casimicrobiaceae bacterium]